MNLFQTLPIRFQNFNKGISLIEMVIYIAILSGISVLVVSSMLSFSRSYSALSATKRINTAAFTALDRMERDIRASSGVNIASSTLTTHPGVLVLDTLDEGGSPTSVSFYLDGSTLRVVEGGVAAGKLTQDSVSVTNLVFQRVTNARSEVVKIDMQLTATRGSITKVIPFHASAVMRGAY